MSALFLQAAAGAAAACTGLHRHKKSEPAGSLFSLTAALPA
jgi:hypothetical protein